MARYEVLVTRAIVQEATIEVQAGSLHQALHRGARVADETPGLNWTTEHTEPAVAMTASRRLTAGRAV